MTPEMLAAAIIRSNRYLTLATVGDDGPWATPLAFSVEPDFSLVFYTALEARHTRHTATDPNVAGAIFNSALLSDDADGIQFRGKCEVVNEADLQEVMHRYFLQSFPDETIRQRWMRPIDDFTGTAPQRFYRIRLTEMGKPDLTSMAVDRRLTLDIAGVKAAYFGV